MSVKVEERRDKKTGKYKGWYVITHWHGQRKAKCFGKNKQQAKAFADKLDARLRWAEQSGEPIVLSQPDQTIKPRRKTFERLTWQADNEIRVDVDRRLLSQPREIFLGNVVVLFATDQIGDFVIERLNADFELQHFARKLRDKIFEGLGKSVGDQFEMQEHSRPIPLEKEFENGTTDSQIQVKRPVHELE